MSTFLNTLFDPEDGVCTGEAKAVNVWVRDVAPVAAPFVCINALDLERDRHPQKDWHNTDKPRRADHNVTKHRTWLVECDTETIDRQREIVHGCGLPFSTEVLSGGKSVHYLVCLRTPVSSYETYVALGRRLLHGLRCMGVPCDVSTSNPSRLSRLAGAVRDTGALQPLLSCPGRQSNLKVMEFILGLPAQPIKARTPRMGYDGTKQAAPMWLQRQLQFGILGPSNSRSQTVFAAALELAYCGWDEPEITQYLTPMRDWFGTDYANDRLEVKIKEAIHAFNSNWQGKS